MPEQFKAAKNMVISTDKVTASIFKNSNIFANSQGLNVKTSRKNNMVVTVDLPPGAEKVGWETPLTLFDREVLDTINTLIEAGNKAITTDQIYRHMIGQPHCKRKAVKNTATAIEATMNSLRSKVIRIDATQEAKTYGFTPGHDGQVIIEGSILSFRKITITAGGNQVTAFVIDSSLLYQNYSKAKKQVASILPITCNAVPGIKHTTANTELIGYLKRRILAMRPTQRQSKRPLSKKINIANMLEDLGVAYKADKASDAVRAAKSRTLKATYKILNYWQSVICEDGKPFIKSYSIIGKKPVQNIEISF